VAGETPAFAAISMIPAIRVQRYAKNCKNQEFSMLRFFTVKDMYM
jgi:hypothetical protein